jgi:hypothetical protein
MKHAVDKGKKPDLTNVSEKDLLMAMVEVTLRNKQFDSRDMTDLEAINEEFKRRDSLKISRIR